MPPVWLIDRVPVVTRDGLKRHWLLWTLLGRLAHAAVQLVEAAHGALEILFAGLVRAQQVRREGVLSWSRLAGNRAGALHRRVMGLLQKTGVGVRRDRPVHGCPRIVVDAWLRHWL